MRICIHCKEAKEIEEFLNYISPRPRCLECNERLNFERAIKDEEKAKIKLQSEGIELPLNTTYRQLEAKIKRIKVKYNLEYKDYLILVERSQGKCEICKTQPFIAIDHCHRTGKVRGLLCHRCNYGLGVFLDNIESLLNAAEYLRTKS